MGEVISSWKDEMEGWSDMIIINGNGPWKLNPKEKALEMLIRWDQGSENCELSGMSPK